MKDIESPLPIREYIKDLNTKAYYLLVALGFLYRRSPGIDSLKWASTLTALVAVLPIQDFLKSRFALEGSRALKDCHAHNWDLRFAPGGCHRHC
jgi:hypothetical protein